MSSQDSITRWIAEVRAGDSNATRQLWLHYFDRLVVLARRRLTNVNTCIRDEEDVALSVFERFRTSAQQGRYPDLNDRQSLWRLLVKMTKDKSVDFHRYESRMRRGAGKKIDESSGPREAIDLEPSPESVAILSEQLVCFLERLQREDLKEIALSKLEGYTNKELAKKMNCSERTIERRLALIKARCEQEFTDGG